MHDIWRDIIGGQPGNNMVAFLAMLVSLVVAWRSVAAERRGEARAIKAEGDAKAESEAVEARFNKVEQREKAFHDGDHEHQKVLRTAAVYMQLEVHSSEIFKFTAAHATLIEDFRKETEPRYRWESGKYTHARETALNLYFQSLNLFEVSARMRRGDLFPKEVFASWVAWFYEVLSSWYFRKEWHDQIRANYTSDVRRIFDAGCDIFAQIESGDARMAAFYEAVAFVMRDENAPGCCDVADWLDDLEDSLQWQQVIEARESHSAGTIPPPPPPQPPLSPAM